MDSTLLILIVSTCVGAVGTLLGFFKKNIKNIKCCFGSGVEFKETPPASEHNEEVTHVSPNANQLELWENIQPYNRKIVISQI